MLNPTHHHRVPTLHSMPRRMIGALALLVAACPIANAQPPAPIKPIAPAPAPAANEDERTELVVHLKDGRQFTGPVVRQNSAEVVINISGIAQPFRTEDIDRLEVLEPLMERYAKFREAVGNDPDQIVNLAEWLQQRAKYELALTEVIRALAIDKTNGPALKLRQFLEQQIILKHQRVHRQPDPEPRAPPRPLPARPASFPLLSEPDVQIIKVFETKLDEKPRVIIQRPVATKMLEKYADHPLVPLTREGRETVLRRSPLEILDLMFKLQARDFYSQVDVLDPPRAFPIFRDQVCRTWLVNACSTTLCHGGTEAGRLVLYNHHPNMERTVYTNFYILSKFRLADGSALVNWDEPEKSPLVQMGLPREKSRRPHPSVPHGTSGRDMFKPVFQSADDVQFKEAVSWIKSLYRPRPEYPITYTPVRPFEPAPKPKPVEPAPAIKPATDPPSGATLAPKQEPKSP